MADLPPPLRDLLHHADERLLAGWYRAISLSADRVRRTLRRAGHRYAGDDQPTPPSSHELEHAARWVIDQSRFGATAIGGIAGLGGIASVPPETLAQLVGAVRLGQRLAVVYGFDPDTERGRLALSRALAAGFEVELPDRGPVGLRVSDLPAVILPAIAPRTVTSELLGSMVRKSAWSLVARVSRLLPVAGAGFGAAEARRTRAEIGGRMVHVFRQLSDSHPGGALEEAVEVG